ncbi:unnamed protein product [Closterium sp. NIES-54]
MPCPASRCPRAPCRALPCAVLLPAARAARALPLPARALPLHARTLPLPPTRCLRLPARSNCRPTRCSPVASPAGPRAAFARKRAAPAGPRAAFCPPARCLCPPARSLCRPARHLSAALRARALRLPPARRPCLSTCRLYCARTASAARVLSLLPERCLCLPVPRTVVMATLNVLMFDPDGRPIEFATWLDDLQLCLMTDAKDGVSLFNQASGSSVEPPDTADNLSHSQWQTRDAAARLAIRNHLPLAEHAHFGQHKTAKDLYTAVVARYSSPATAALSRLILPYLFPELGHFLMLDPTALIVDDFEKHLLAAEKSIIAVGASRGTPRTPLFKGCSSSPLARSYASTAAVDFLGVEEVGAASAPSGKRCSSKGKGGRSGGGGGRGGRWWMSNYNCYTAATAVVSAAAVAAAAAQVAAAAVVTLDACVVSSPGASEVLSVGAAATIRLVPPFVAGSGATSPAARLSFTLDSRASSCFFRDCTDLTPLHTPVTVALADPSVGFVVADSTTTLPCPAAPSGFLTGYYTPSFSRNLVGVSHLHDLGVVTTFPLHDPIASCTVGATGAPLATFHREPGSGLPESLAPLPRSPAPPSTLCIEGRQRAAPHSSLFPPTTAPLQTLHLDVWDPPRSVAHANVPTFLEPWLLARGGVQGLCRLRLHSDRGGEFSSTRLETFCQGRGIIQSYTLPDSPQQNGVAERRIGVVIEVARTSMCHAGAPQFLWPQAVRYAAHQLNLWPCDARPRVTPIFLWTGFPGVAVDYRVWGCLAHVRAPGANKLSVHTRACVFLGFSLDASDWVFYDRVTYQFFSSQNVTFNESSSPPHHPVSDVSGGAGGAAVGGEGTGAAGVGGSGSGGAGGVGGEAPPVDDTAALSRQPHPTSPPGFPLVPQFPPCSPPQLVAEESGGVPAGDIGGPGGVVGGVSGSGGTGAGGAATSVPTPRTVRFLTHEQRLVRLEREERERFERAQQQQQDFRLERQERVEEELRQQQQQSQSERQERVEEESQPRQERVEEESQQQQQQQKSQSECKAAATERPARLITCTFCSWSPTVPSSSPCRAPFLVPVDFTCYHCHDFASSNRLNYAAHLVSGPARSPSSGGALVFPLEVLEDRQFELGFLAAAVPHLCAMLLAPEGDPDALDIPIPRTHAEAVSGPWASYWIAVEEAEMASYRSTATYVDTVPRPGTIVASGMWLYKVKRPPGAPAVFKARYVARSFSQQEGVDFFHTFAPTPKMSTVRVLLHIAVQRDYELHSLDFSTAFLQGGLHEQIWLRCPPGFTGSFSPGTQWQLP